MKRKHGENIGSMKLLLLGALGSGILLAIVSFILALICMRMENSSGAANIMPLVALLITGAVSGFVISKIKGEGGVLTGVLSSLFFVLTLLIAALIITGGNVSAKCPLNYICYMGIASLFAFFGKKKNKRRR